MIYKFHLILVLALISGVIGCTSWQVSPSDPEKRYQAYWDQDILTGCYDDRFGNRKCDYIDPPWETPRLMYSMLAPEGEWEVYRVNSKEKAGYLFVMHPGKRSGGYRFKIDYEIYPITDESRIATIKNTIENENYDQQLKSSIEEFKAKKGLINNLNAKEIKGQLVDINGLTCVELSWVQHYGPSPDPEVSGEWAGKGSYMKKFPTKCYLKGPELYWVLRIYGFMSLTDDLGNFIGKDDRIFHPEKAEMDFRRRLQRMFDSLEFNGLYQ